MTLDKSLDYAIRDFETKEDPTVTYGYKTNDDHTYDNYMSEESFEKLKAGMTPQARKSYGDGSGSELEVRRDKDGSLKYPPKMASFGSSSRFIYTLVNKKLKNENFVFELQLPTRVGGTANLDGYFEKEKHIFVEAKCREPYGTKTNEFGDKYEDLYIYINKSTESNVFCKTKRIPDKKKITADFSVKINDELPCEEITHFDIKQMISHLLGIGVAILKDGKYLDKPIKFLYLIYDPRDLKFDNSEIYEKIVNIHGKTCCECESVDFKGLFRVILKFLQKEYKYDSDIDIDKIIDKFTFEICSQNDFVKKISNRY